MTFVRKAAKAYGTCRIVEGYEVGGRHVVVVEDVITSGGQVAKAVDDLRRLGATVQHAVCVIDRVSAGRALLEGIGVELRALFTADDLNEARNSTP